MPLLYDGRFTRLLRHRVRVDLSPMPPWVRRCLIGTHIVWLFCMLVLGTTGGTAIGTNVTAGVFYVAQYGNRSAVSEIDWLGNLVFSWAGLGAPFIATWIALPYRTQVLPIDKPAKALDDRRNFGVVLVGWATFGVLWVSLLSFQTLRSLLTYAGFKWR